MCKKKTSMAYLQLVRIETPLSTKVAPEDCHPLALCLGALGFQHPLSRNWQCEHSHLQSQAATAVLGEKLDPLGLESRMHSLAVASWGRLCRLQLPHRIVEQFRTQDCCRFASSTFLYPRDDACVDVGKPRKYFSGFISSCLDLPSLIGQSSRATVKICFNSNPICCQD